MVAVQFGAKSTGLNFLCLSKHSKPCKKMGKPVCCQVITTDGAIYQDGRQKELPENDEKL